MPVRRFLHFLRHGSENVLQHIFADPGPHGAQRAVAAHGKADQAHSVGQQHAPQEAFAVQRFQLGNHKPLIQRPMNHGAFDGALSGKIGVGVVRVPDGEHHVAFAGQVFRQIDQQDAVGNYHHRAGADGSVRRRVPESPAFNGKRRQVVLIRPAHIIGVHRPGIVRARQGGIPYLHRQGPVIPGKTPVPLSCQHVRLIGVGQGDGTHARHRVSAGSQHRRARQGIAQHGAHGMLLLPIAHKNRSLLS